MSRHDLVNPPGMAPATGFSYGALAAEGSLFHLAGITGHREDGSIDEALVDQFRAACESVAKVIGEAGGSPSDLLSMTIFTSDIEAYRAQPRELGEAYRSVFAKHYPPMALFGISELYDPKALVELVCVAVVPLR
jgi:enamine deaminase RidA (YjgF/YER057c/UK114 family)